MCVYVRMCVYVCGGASVAKTTTSNLSCQYYNTIIIWKYLDIHVILKIVRSLTKMNITAIILYKKLCNDWYNNIIWILIK